MTPKDRCLIVRKDTGINVDGSKFIDDDVKLHSKKTVSLEFRVNMGVFLKLDDTYLKEQ